MVNYRWLIIGIMIGGGSLLTTKYLYSTFKTQLPQEKPPLYKTVPVKRRNLVREVQATGMLEVEGTVKLGSLVAGVIERMYVMEDAPVTRGMVLAVIDDGISDTRVRSTAAKMQQSKNKLTYQKAFYRRQKALFEQDQISADYFEQVERDYRNAQEDLQSDTADFDAATIEFNNKKIRSPQDGIVVGKHVSQGETVSLSSPATIIYTIATNLDRMELKLAIKEADIAHVRVGQTVVLEFEAYPHEFFEGTIRSVSNYAYRTNDTVTYNATLILDNADRRLRAGMTAQAKIAVAAKDDILTVPIRAFSIENKKIKKIAQTIPCPYNPIAPEADSLVQKQAMVWIFDGTGFTQKCVEIGMSDGDFAEILAGLQEGTAVVVAA